MSGTKRRVSERLGFTWRSELEKLSAKKALKPVHVRRIRDLMQQEAKMMGQQPRPNAALILKSYEAREEWQVSVRAGQTVRVLDKMSDGFWLLDLSCEGRGPFGLVPGIHCCWTTTQLEDAIVAPGTAARSSQLDADPPGSGGSGAERSTPVAAPPLPPRPPPGTTAVDMACDDTPGDAAPEPMTPEEEDASDASGSAAPPLPPRPKPYTDQDLQEAYDYVAQLVNGDGFTAVPPEKFNELCTNTEFSDLMRQHIDALRKRRSGEFAATVPTH